MNWLKKYIAASDTFFFILPRQRRAPKDVVRFFFSPFLFPEPGNFSLSLSLFTVTHFVYLLKNISLGEGEENNLFL